MAAPVKVALLIPCGEELHRAVIHRDGTMTLAEHPSIEMMHAFAAFGAALPLCSRRLEMWQDDPALILTMPETDFILGDKVRELPLRELGMMSHDWAKHVVPLATKEFPRVNAWLGDVAGVYQNPSSFTSTDWAVQLELAERVLHKRAGAQQRSVDTHVITTARYALRAAQRWLNIHRTTGIPEWDSSEAIAPDVRYLVMGTSSSGIACAQMTDEMGMLIGAKDAVERGHVEARWQAQRAAEILHDYVEGKPWQPL
jgi:hypothetical protein